jgi:hypothetical protein
MSRISAAARSAAANGVVDLVDAGTGDSHLRIYSGSGPATFGDAPAGDLLAEFDLAATAFGAASAGVATLASTPISTTGLAAGTAGYAVLVDKDDAEVWDTEDLGTSGNEVVLSTLTVSIGLDLDLTAGTITMPAGSL